MVTKRKAEKTSQEKSNTVKRQSKVKPKRAAGPARQDSVNQLLQRAVQPNARLAPSDLHRLQRAVGNRALGQLLSRHGQPATGRRSIIQAKLTLGPVGDKYEQEADQVAKHVVTSLSSSGGQGVQRQEAETVQMMPISSIQRQEDEEEMQMKPLDSIQRQEEEEEMQMKPLDSIQRQEEEEEMQMKPLDSIQRQEEEEEMQMKPLDSIQRQEEEEEMQMKPASTIAGGPINNELENSIQTARSGGQPLSDNVRKPMESAFGADFSGIKVHTGSQSDSLNQSVQARAFTTGQDIFFRSGEYNPGSSAGQELLAHELTHTVQQGAAPVQRQTELPQSAAASPRNSSTPTGMSPVQRKNIINNPRIFTGVSFDKNHLLEGEQLSNAKSEERFKARGNWINTVVAYSGLKKAVGGNKAAISSGGNTTLRIGGSAAKVSTWRNPQDHAKGVKTVDASEIVVTSNQGKIFHLEDAEPVEEGWSTA